MFSNKKKPDSRIRFQHQAFRQQLREARGYKREKRVAEKSWGTFLSDIGLKSWKTRTVAAVLLCLFVYLVYIPNIFYIKNIVITGAAPEAQANLERTIGFYLHSQRAWPQDNLLLLSKSRLKNYIAKNNAGIVA